jgi:serine/threonine protein kinase
MVLAPRTRLGPYEILSLLGVGGMGEVYRARHTRLERTVAIKILSQLSGDPVNRQRFEREARAISSLNHPNICALHDIGQEDGIERFECGDRRGFHFKDGRGYAQPALALEYELAGCHLVKHCAEGEDVAAAIVT